MKNDKQLGFLKDLILEWSCLKSKWIQKSVPNSGAILKQTPENRQHQLQNLVENKAGKAAMKPLTQAYVANGPEVVKN